MDLFRALRRLLPPANPSTIIAFVGAGGKTSTMFELAEQARAASLSVIVSTTTAMRDPRSEAGRPFDHFALVPGLPPRCLPGTITVLAASLREDGKIHGPAPEEVEALRGRAELVLIEADGSRGLPIKAPASHEPCVPPGADLVLGCVGLDCLNQGATASIVHRLAEFLGLTGLAEGDRIDREALCALVLSPVGLFKACPEGSRRILCLSKFDLLADPERRLVESLADRRDLGVDAVLLRSHKQTYEVSHVA